MISAQKPANVSLLIKAGHFAGYVAISLITAGVTAAWTVRGGLSDVHERAEINHNDIVNMRNDVETHWKEQHDQIADLKSDMIRGFADLRQDLHSRNQRSETGN